MELLPTGFRNAACSALRAPRSAFESAFTRAELLVVLAAVALLTLIVLPALANTRPRSARVICAINLRQVSMGFQLWGNDHSDLPPWELRPKQSGTWLHPLGVNAWLHFLWISNELNSARVLLCPSDSGRLADDFSFYPAVISMPITETTRPVTSSATPSWAGNSSCSQETGICGPTVPAVAAAFPK